MSQRGILYLLLAIVGIPVLIQIGAWSATDPLYAGVSAIIVVGIIVLTQLGTRCWLLIPFFASFSGAMNILPGNFAPRDIAVGLVVVMLPALWVIRRFPLRVRLGNLEIALLAVLALVAQAYFRNPVGLSIFGSGVIGGRPYFEIAVSVVAFLILSVLVVDLKSIKMVVFANFFGSMAVSIYDAVLGFFPSLARYGAAIYLSGTTTSSLNEFISGGSDPSRGTGRLIFLKGFANPIMALVLSLRAPMQVLAPRNILFLGLAVFAVVCVLLSGFRSGVANLGFLGIAAFILHRKQMQLVFLTMVGAPLLAVFLVLQGTVIELPLAAQRALSFLPADWNSRAADAAKNSSEWRFLMWQEALTSDRYIRNKWIGDGFGFTAREMAYQQELLATGLGVVDQQEYFLLTGQYHSGPIETIKRIGYIGLVVLLVVMGVFLKEAVSMVNRTRGTPYFPYAMFIALPLLIHPFVFILVFGTFKSSLTTLLLGGGLLRLTKNSIESWKRHQEAAQSLDAAGGVEPSRG
jgi:hypothetical protein